LSAKTVVLKSGVFFDKYKKNEVGVSPMKLTFLKSIIAVGMLCNILPA